MAETGAGQHYAVETYCYAMLDMPCRVLRVGPKDVERQSPNVFRMRLMGAVIPIQKVLAHWKMRA